LPLARLACVALLCAAFVACGPPPFVVHVVFSGPVDVEPGARVLYQGVEVGRVTGVSLEQPSPEAAARVRVSLAIDDPEIRLREADRFHVASEGVMGEDVVEIVPAPQPSPALASGDTVAGVPPILTRMEDALDEAAESAREFVSEAVRQALETLGREDGSEARPPAPSRPPGRQAPPGGAGAGDPAPAPGASGGTGALPPAGRSEPAPPPAAP